MSRIHLWIAYKVTAGPSGGGTFILLSKYLEMVP